MRSLGFASRPLSLAFAVLTLAISTARAGHGEWQWLEEKRGIQVWTLNLPGAVLPGFRGQTKIQGTIAQIVHEMLDAPHHTEWMHRCAESWIYARDGETHGVLYNRTSSAPWPVWDRDVVLDVRFDYGSDGKSLMVRFRNLDDLLRPVPERVVRMPKLVGFYKLVQLAPDLTSVTYQVEVDIGGTIPNWIAEEVAKDLPYYTLLSLRERVEGVRDEAPLPVPSQTPVAIELPAPDARHLRAARD